MIEQFIDEKVNGAFIDGKSTDYLITNPFPYAIIPNVLEKNFFFYIRERCNTLLDKLVRLEDFDIYHTHLTVPELLNVCCSTYFLKLIEKIFNLKVKRKQDQFPSLRILKEGSNGLHIHNDEAYIGNVTVFLYLSDWKEGFGGEVNIYKKINGEFIQINSVRPLPNSLLVMPITDKIMYHDISPTSVGYLRKCAYFPISLI